MKASEIVGILLGVAGLGVAGFVAYRQFRPNPLAVPAYASQGNPVGGFSYNAGPGNQGNTGILPPQLGGQIATTATAVVQGIGAVANVINGIGSLFGGGSGGGL